MKVVFLSLIVSCKQNIWRPFGGHRGATESAAVFYTEGSELLSLRRAACCHGDLPQSEKVGSSQRSVVSRFQALRHPPPTSPPLRQLPQQQVS